MQFPLNGSDIFSGIYAINLCCKHKDVIMKTRATENTDYLASNFLDDNINALTPLHGQDSIKTQLSSKESV